MQMIGHAKAAGKTGGSKLLVIAGEVTCSHHYIMNFRPVVTKIREKICAGVR